MAKNKINSIKDEIREIKIKLVRLNKLMEQVEAKLTSDDLTVWKNERSQVDIHILRKKIDELRSEFDLKSSELLKEEAREYIAENVMTTDPVRRYVKWLGDKCDVDNKHDQNHLQAIYKEIGLDTFVDLRGQFAYMFMNQRMESVDGRKRAERMILSMLMKSVESCGNLLEIKELSTVNKDGEIELTGLIIGEQKIMRMHIEASGGNSKNALRTKITFSYL